jgi:methionyl aminopeptidase
MPQTIYLKSTAEIGILREANRIVAEALTILREKVRPGISTWELDQLAERHAIKRKAVPAFKGYRGFPGSLCVSINEEVVHGIPSKKVVLQEGDIVSIDFGVRFRNFYGDAAVTLPVGKISGEKERLLEVTNAALHKGIMQAVAGNRINDISCAVQDHVEQNGFSVVRQFVGHGIGSQLHEPPEIPNYCRKETTPRMQPGMVLAIEPMVNIGGGEVTVLKDGWTVVTRDGKPSAHFEHSIAVTENGPLILSELGQ